MYTLGAIYLLSNFSCDQAESIKETFSALDCANLIVKIDEEYDREDKDCSEISDDIDDILKTCREFLDEDDVAQLEFYKANCSEGN